MNSPATPPQSPTDRLKVLINSSTPIVVMETVEEMRAMSLVRTACSDLSLPVFEWSIADGLVRCGSGVPASALSAIGSEAGLAPKTAMYNTADPVQALANLETMTIEAVFVLKDFHRHMENPVVVRRLHHRCTRRQESFAEAVGNAGVRGFNRQHGQHRRPGQSENLARTTAKFLGRASHPVRPRSAERRHHSRRPRLRQESLRPRRSRRVETPAGEIRYRRRL